MTFVIADLDNTLVDRVDAFRRWATRFLEARSLSADLLARLEELDSDGMRPRDEFFEKVAERVGIEYSVIESDYLARYPSSFILDSLVVDELTRLREAGHVIGIATNGPAFQDDVILCSGLAGHVDGWVVSAIAGYRKPDIRILDALSVTDDDCVVVGDGVADIELAHNLGVPSIWVERGKTWNADLHFGPSQSVRSTIEALRLIGSD